MRLARYSGRALWAARGSVLLVVAVLALISGVLTAWPRLEANAFAEQSRHRLEQTTSTVRDVFSHPTVWPLGLGEPVEVDWDAAFWEPYMAALKQIRAEQPTPLREVLASPDALALAADSSLPLTSEQKTATGLARAGVVPFTDPAFADRVELTQGEWPQPPRWDQMPDPDAPLVPEEDWVPPALLVEIAMPEESAEQLHWAVGEEWSTYLGFAEARLTLTGTYRALDPEATLWQHHPAAVNPHVVDDLNAGKSLSTYVYLPSGGWWDLIAATGGNSDMWVRYAANPDGLGQADPAALGTQLRAFTSKAHQLRLVGSDGDAISFSMRPSSELAPVLDRIAAESTALGRVVTIVAVGPLGVALTVLVLLARAVLARRRAAVALLRLRGASDLRLRGLLALEGLVIGLPAAALGWLGAVALVPADTGALGLAGWLPGLLAGLVPAVALGLSALPWPMRRERREGRAVPVVRDVVVLAAAAVVAVQVHGGEEGAVGARGDVLITLAPLVLAAAVAVVVMRLYPVLARAARAVARRRPGLPGWLGSALAIREGGASVPAVLAVVVAVAVAVFSGGTLATFRAGVAETVWTDTGGGLRVSGPAVPADVLAQVRELDGVAAAATVATTTATVRTGQAQQRAELVLVDPEAFAAVLQGAPTTLGAPTLPGDLVGDGDVLPVILSSSLDLPVGAAIELVPSDRPEAEVVDLGRALPGVAGPSAAWVLADAAAFPSLEVSAPARTLLVRVAPGGDADAVAEQVLELTGPAAVTSAAEQEAQVLKTPAVALLELALTVTVLAAGALAVAALFLVQVASAPARAVMVARLRVLGLRRWGERALAWWYLMPWVTLASLAGLGLGRGLTALLEPALGLRAFTGSPATAAVAWWQLLAVLAVAVAVAAAVTLLTTRGRRIDPVRTLEED